MRKANLQRKMIKFLVFYIAILLIFSGYKYFENFIPCRHSWADASCTEPKYCTICDTKEGEPLGHTPETIPGKEATCIETGLTDGSKCSVCGEILTAQEEIPAKGHTPEVVPVKEATCTETGLTEGSKCSVCGEILTAQEEIPAKGHTPETIPGKEATCTETGLTDGSKCSVCGEILTAQEEIPAKGHTPETIPGKEATCTETGLTDGSKCSVCGEILTAQEEIPAKGHTPEVVPGKEATCTETGLTDGSKCSVCGEILTAQEEIPAKGHTPEVVPDKEATCIETGLTEGSKCSVCGEILTAQEEIPLGEHQYSDWFSFYIGERDLQTNTRCCIVCGIVEYQADGDETVYTPEEFEEYLGADGVHLHKNIEAFAKIEPTCTADGYEYKIICLDCGETVYTKVLSALGHDWQDVESGHVCMHICECARCGLSETTYTHNWEQTEYKAPTCAEPGYQKLVCSICNAVSEKELEMLNTHTWEQIEYKAPTCAEPGYQKLVCSICNAVSEKELEVLNTHTWEQIEYTAPTCTEQGYKKQVCSVCNAVSEGVLNALGHNVSVVCDNNIHTEKCLRCGEVYATGEHTIEIGSTTTRTESGNIATYTTVFSYICTGLDGRCPYNSEITRSSIDVSIDNDSVSPIEYSYEKTEPTCTADGVFILKNKLTGEEISRTVIPAKGHTEVSADAELADCGNSGLTAGTVCCICGETVTGREIIPATGEHSFGENDICTVCGMMKASEGLVFTLDSSKTAYSLTGIGTCTDTVVVIPAIYEGLPVTSIGANVFKNCTSITSVIIPDSVTSIGYGVFYNCTSLESIEIPSSVTSIGDSVFYNCTSLESIEIPDSVTSIGSSAFYKCTSLVSVNFGENSQLTSIDSAFKGCTSLESIEMPDSVTRIGGRAFYNCTSLASIEIPEGVTSIGSYAFDGCTSLVSIEIPEGVTSIGDYTFKNCTSLESIEIPEGVTSIGYEAFYRCTSLESIEIPDSVTSIGKYAFYNCTSLASITLPFVGATENGTSNTHFGYIFGASSYSYNSSYVPSSLKTVIITGETSIETKAFYNCLSLVSIDIPSSVTSIGSSAFSGCTSLYVVYNNSNLTLTIGSTDNGYIAYYAKVIFDSEGNATYKEESGTTYTLTDYGFLFKYSDSKYTLIAYIGGEKTVTLPQDINGESYEIYRMRGVVNVIIPEGITSIGSYAFYKCTSLESIEIPNSVTSIGDYAFYGCTSLVSIEIPNSVTSIGDYAFYGCTSLESITLPFVGATENGTSNTHFGYIFGASSYDYNSSYVPSSLKTVIITGGTSIGEFAFYGCTSLVNMEIPDSVTSIGSSAFENCTSLESIEIPDSVTSIGSYAFDNCTSLVNIEIPSSVTSIGDYAFDNCTSLASVNFGENSQLTSIGDSAFYKCTSLVNIVIPDSVTSIGHGAFRDCTSLESITLPFVGATKNGTSNTHFGYIFGASYYYYNSSYVPSSLKTVIITGGTSIGSYAFYKCTSLVSIEIPDSVTSIGHSAFSGCTSLVSIEIPDSVTSIGYEAFYNCTSLESIEIPSSVTSIGYEAFYNCTSLTDVYFAGTEEQWAAISINSSGNSWLTNATVHYSSKNAE